MPHQPPTKIKVDTGIFSTPERRKQLRDAADEKLRKDRLAAARARTSPEAKIAETVQRQTQDRTQRDIAEARRVSAGVREGQTFIPNLEQDVGGPVTLVGKAITEVLETPRELAFPAALNILGSGTKEFKDEVTRQQEIVRETHEYGDNFFGWFMSQIDQQLIAPSIAGDITRGTFPQFKINLPGEKVDFTLGLYELGTELTDPLLYFGPGRVAIEKLAIPLIKGTLGTTLKAADIVGESALAISKNLREGSIKFNSEIGQYMTNAAGKALPERKVFAEGLEDVVSPQPPKVKEIFGKTPSQNWREQSSSKLLADDMIPRLPETTMTNPMKDAAFTNVGLTLTDNQELVFRHINTLGKTVKDPKTGKKVFKPGIIQNLADQLTKLAEVTDDAGELVFPEIGGGKLGVTGGTLKGRLQAVARGTVRYMKTAYGTRQAINVNLLFEAHDAIVRQVDSQFGTGYSKILQKMVGVDFIDDLAGFTVRERFPLVIHEISIEVDNFIGAVQETIGNAAWDLHNTYDNILNSTQFNVTEALVKSKKTGDMVPGSVRGAFTEIDRLVDEKLYTSKQSQALKLAIMFQTPDAFKLTRAEGELIKRVGRMMQDGVNMEILGGAYRGPTKLAEWYLPAIWKFEKDLLDAEGRLTDKAMERIFGKVQFFEKDKQWPSIADAVRIMAARDEPISLADEVANPLDLVMLRLMGGTRLIADKYLNDAVEIGLKTDLITVDQARAFKSIKGGGSGELRGATEKMVGRLTQASLAGPSRLIRFSMDIGALGVQAAPSINYLAANPKKTLEMWGTAMKYIMTPKGFQEYRAANPQLWGEARRAGLLVGQEILQKEQGGQWIEMVPRFRKGQIFGRNIPFTKIESSKFYTIKENVPFVGGMNVYNPIATLNKAQFGRLMAVLKLYSFQMETDVLWSDSAWNKVQRSLTGVRVVKRVLPIPTGTKKLVQSKLEAQYVAAQAVNERYGGVGNTRALQGRALRQALTVALATPDFAQSTMASLLRAGVSTAEGALARGFWMRYLIIAAAGVKLLDTIDDDDTNIFRVQDSDWFLKKFPKDVWNPLGRFRGHFRLFAGVVEDVNDFYGGEIPRDLGNDVDLRATNTITRLQQFLTGRVSVPIEQIIRLSSQKSFDGDPIWDAEADIDVLDYVAYVATHGPVPISVNQWLEDRKRNSITNFGLFSYVFGFAQYPLDLVREDARVRLEESLVQHLGDITGGNIPLTTIKTLARDAVTNKQSKFGNRVRPSRIINPFTGERFNMDMDVVYGIMAQKMNFWTDAGDPDIELARRLGSPEMLTPAEHKEQLQFLKEVAFERFGQLSEERLTKTNFIETQYGYGLEYPTLQSAFKQVGLLMGHFRANRRSLQEDYGVTLDALRDLRVTPTQQDLAFDEVRKMLDETVNLDGKVDHWNRIRMLEQLEEKLGPELIDKFFTRTDIVEESHLLRTWRAASTTASGYYEIAAKMFTEEEFRLYREVNIVMGDALETQRYIDEFGENQLNEGATLGFMVQNERARQLLTDFEDEPGSPELVAMEVALYLLDGRTPQKSATLELFKYHTGVEYPSRTDVFDKIDTEDLISILEATP